MSATLFDLLVNQGRLPLGSRSFGMYPTAMTIPATSTSKASRGGTPRSQPSIRAIRPQFPPPDARSAMSTSSARSSDGSGESNDFDWSAQAADSALERCRPLDPRASVDPTQPAMIAAGRLALRSGRARPMRMRRGRDGSARVLVVDDDSALRRCLQHSSAMKEFQWR